MNQTLQICRRRLGRPKHENEKTTESRQRNKIFLLSITCRGAA